MLNPRPWFKGLLYDQCKKSVISKVTKSNAQVKNDGNEVSKSECPVLPDVAQHNGAQDGGVQLEANLKESIF